jgi:hypothetical protein
MVTWAVPLALVAVVKVNVPSVLRAGWDENSVALSLVAAKVRCCEASFVGPGLMAVAQAAMTCAPASSFTVTSAPLVTTGGSFTGLTVMAKNCGALVSRPPLAVLPSSLKHHRDVSDSVRVR